ncbi:hypothetical protein DOM21_15365 [Bacteriovorax stolpii]|uniref:Tripartite ATP-independent periplasmic transporters DctQ component domain-containing protein n=1 Tax=Bacteriovorax stolpii TaxID=960 RepID=A0A2K9NP34_BACTC|nr:TRAP transporter small permease subunit [Bacteriovorax stolpii]AUN97258.1 hypothetical protein C0V70_03860 [Bacteriovorax stolpii]QDK42804.1 hypothetical protein DOM21_15365 [Bacteriovorax stolpii]TDP52428.1 TRAP-type C4-dicarboxylate transport system permease small subunit [Bacteriovorax stolpii]
MFSLVKKCDNIVEKIATWLLVICVMSMLIFSSLSIVARWFHHNITWIDPFVRHLVFIGTFLGGVVATGKGTHIGIDIVGKFVESKGWHSAKTAISRIIMVSSMFVLLWLIKSGVDFTRVEMEFSKEEFWGIGSGYLVMIIPIGLAFLLVRFFLVFLLSFEAKKEGAL